MTDMELMAQVGTRAFGARLEFQEDWWRRADATPVVVR
jgi:hypothetical protein